MGTQSGHTEQHAPNLDILAQEDARFVVRYFAALECKYDAEEPPVDLRPWKQQARDRRGRKYILSLKSTLHQMKAAHDPWIAPNPFTPELTIFGLGGERKVHDSEMWWFLLKRSKSSSPMFAASPTVVVTEGYLNNCPQMISHEAFVRALYSAAMLRIIFHTSLSAIAAML